MVYLLVFSPSGGTSSVARAAAARLAARLGQPLEVQDVTPPVERMLPHGYTPQDTVLAACPTYAGRVPNKTLPFWQEKLQGCGARAAVLTTYGGRSPDSSAAELCSLLQGAGFSVIGKGSFVCRHAMSKTLCAGRPDADDLREAEAYADALAEKLLGGDPQPLGDFGEIAPYYTPLKEDGTPAKFLKARPVHDTVKCRSCGRCTAVCPMGSISPWAPYDTVSTCIKCHACIRVCPSKARYFADEDLLSHINYLEAHYGGRKAENSWQV